MNLGIVPFLNSLGAIGEICNLFSDNFTARLLVLFSAVLAIYVDLKCLKLGTSLNDNWVMRCR